jgi:predicted transcriptional regulator
MAQPSVKTDIIISIHPEHVSNIVSRVKDHEYRNYLIPSCVRRIWIYETRHTSAIKYVAQISSGKRPGEITNTKGLRNSEFNEGKIGGYAYEILDLQATPYPWTLQELKAKGWLNGPPQKYCYAKASMIDALRDIALIKLFAPSTLPLADVVEAGSSEKASFDDNCRHSEDRPSKLQIKAAASQSRWPSK